MHNIIEDKKEKDISRFIQANQWIIAFFLGSVWIVLCDKPVHLDESNFLAMTQGSFWRPHNILINWEGVKEPAFDVLSNPPGMPWILWPVKDLSVFWMRMWVLPWALCVLWSIRHLGNSWNDWESKAADQNPSKSLGDISMWLLMSSPFFMISMNSLMPEMPLLACTFYGLQSIRRQKWILWGAFIAGFACWFRYSGLTVIPLILLLLWQKKPQYWKWASVVVFIPLLGLIMHDLHAYGKWHFWQMISFQSEQHSLSSLFHKIGAFEAMLVGGFVWPLSREYWSLRKGLMTLILAMVLVFSLVDWDFRYLWSVFFVWMGLILSIHTLRFLWTSKEWVLLCWLLGGIFFLWNLRFAATRYWGPFVFPYILVLARSMDWSRERCFSIFGVISFLLAWDDRNLAIAQHSLAEKTLEHIGDEQLYFAGHWGFQYALEQRKIEPINDDSIIPNNVWFARSEYSWSQEVKNLCWDQQLTFAEHAASWHFLRIHSLQSASNYHSYMISQTPPVWTFAPWGLGWDDWDRIVLRHSCP